LIELNPRLSASSQTPFRRIDQLPALTVSNEGYLKFTDVNVGCSIVDLQPAMIRDGFNITQPPEKVRQPGEPLTVPCTQHVAFGFGFGPNGSLEPITYADIAFVVSFRPWPFSFIRRTKFLRFEGKWDGKETKWYRQPARNIEEEFNGFLLRTHTRFPEA